MGSAVPVGSPSDVEGDKVSLFGAKGLEFSQLAQG